MEADIQIEQMGKDVARNSSDCSLRDIGKDGIAKLVEQRREDSSEPIWNMRSASDREHT
jgi:hypothetical protein